MGRFYVKWWYVALAFVSTTMLALSIVLMAVL
jgi:hypothetical protein